MQGLLISRTILDYIGHYATYGSIAVLTVNIFVYGMCFSKLSTPLRRLFYFLIWSLIIEILAYVISTILGNNNLPLLHLYTLGEFILLSYFYKSLIYKPVVFQKKYKIFIAILGICILLNSIFIQDIYEFNSYAKSLVNVIIIIYSMLYFYNLVENQSFSKETSNSRIRLVNAAIIFYYSGSLFIFMYGKVSFFQTEEYVVFWIFNSFLVLIFQVFILLAIWKVFFRKIILPS